MSKVSTMKEYLLTRLDVFIDTSDIMPYIENIDRNFSSVTMTSHYITNNKKYYKTIIRHN